MEIIANKFYIQGDSGKKIEMVLRRAIRMLRFPYSLTSSPHHFVWGGGMGVGKQLIQLTKNSMPHFIFYSD